MRRIPLSVKNQSIETSGITKDYKEAICEYIWNGFEANAKNVELEWKHNQLDGGDIISIADNGDGINFNNLDNTFGTFLASQKNSLSLKAKSKANKGNKLYKTKQYWIDKWKIMHDKECMENEIDNLSVKSL